MLEKKNYEVNKNISLPDSFINGQALGAVSRMRYGLFPMSYNGCEMIAICNYMRMLGKKENIAEEIYMKLDEHMQKALSFHEQLADYFCFLGLQGFKRNCATTICLAAGTDLL